MKRAIAMALAAGLMVVGCGGIEPDAVEVKQGAVTGTRLGRYQADHSDTAHNFIQQVPSGTLSDQHLDDGTGGRYTYNEDSGGILVQGSTYGSTIVSGSFHNDSLRLQLNQGAVTDPQMVGEIQNGLELANPLASQLGEFPVNFGLGSKPTTSETVGLQSGSPAVHAAGGGWTSSVSRVRVEYTWPQASGYTGTATGSAPSAIFMRVDVVFPMWGVTNRYWFKFNRTGN